MIARNLQNIFMVAHTYERATVIVIDVRTQADFRVVRSFSVVASYWNRKHRQKFLRITSENAIDRRCNQLWQRSVSGLRLLEHRHVREDARDVTAHRQAALQEQGLLYNHRQCEQNVNKHLHCRSSLTKRISSRRPQSLSSTILMSSESAEPTATTWRTSTSSYPSVSSTFSQHRRRTSRSIFSELLLSPESSTPSSTPSTRCSRPARSLGSHATASPATWQFKFSSSSCKICSIDNVK